jgi:hypothetical protein
MMIIKTLSVASELSSRYGLPDNHWGLITSSSSAYMNQELFDMYLEQILLPGVKAQCTKFGLPTDAPALLILDGCLAHSKEKLDKLEKENISYHFLVPHSSHLTQALDRGVLSVFKRKMKQGHKSDFENRVSIRIEHGFDAMQQACSVKNIIGSFQRAGITVDFSAEQPAAVMNVRSWLNQDDSPVTDVKIDSFNQRNKKGSGKHTCVAFRGQTMKEKGENLPSQKKAKKTPATPIETVTTTKKLAAPIATPGVSGNDQQVSF